MKQSRLAQRKLNKNKPRVVSRKKPRKTIYFLAIFAFLTLVIVFCLVVISDSWNGTSKLAIAAQKEDGAVTVTILDPQNSAITVIEIPKEVEVAAANGLGTWKLGSITKLGKDKKIENGFLKNTLIKSFNYPIDRQSSKDFPVFTAGKPLEILSLLFKNTVSDFSLIEKLRIAWFSIGVGSGRSYVDLAKTPTLERVKLTDSTLGWKITGNTPSNIQSYFVELRLTNNSLNVLINNATESSEPAKMVGKTIDVLGFNVASVQTVATVLDLDCEVTSESKEAVAKIVKIFSCKRVYAKPQNNFDIQIDLGVKFKDRF